MFIDRLKQIKKKLDDFDDQRREKRRKQADVVDEELEVAITGTEGESINRKTMLRAIGRHTVPFNLLDDGEQPHYFLNGSTIDVEGQGAGSESIIDWDRDRRIGSAYTVITDQRVLVIANHARGYDEHTIPYDSITAVNLNFGLTSTRLSIQTKSATYHCSVSKAKRRYSRDEVENAVEYLRKRRQQGLETGSTDDSLVRIEQIKSLYEDGTLTEEEFKEKKAELLDEI